MQNSQIILDVINLSSGTMAGLTSKYTYEELDRIHAAFVCFIVNSPRNFSTWARAWGTFSASEAFTDFIGENQQPQA